MNEKQKAKIILKTLNKIYPKAPVPLKSKNTFTLLISVLLSAQCTDVNVNNVNILFMKSENENINQRVKLVEECCWSSWQKYVIYDSLTMYAWICNL